MKDQIPELHDWLKEAGVSVELRQHSLSKDLDKLSGVMDTEALDHVISLINPQQLIASSSRGDISVIQGRASFGAIEIYTIKGDLGIDDIERYETVEDEGHRIKYLFNRSWWSKWFESIKSKIFGRI